MSILRQTNYATSAVRLRRCSFLRIAADALLTRALHPNPFETNDMPPTYETMHQSTNGLFSEGGPVAHMARSGTALDTMEVYKEVGLISYESDILARGLDVIFCGLNPASSAAAAGHNFSSGTNRFWAVLHLAGFTDVRLQPQDERLLLEYGCGITAVVRRPTKRAAEVSPEEFRQARLGFEAKMRHYAPRSIAFLGKRALSAMIGLPDVDWARLPTQFAGTMTWLLPNPSGLNRGFTRDALVSAYEEFRIALAQSTAA